jgi:hypothetical protein
LCFATDLELPGWNCFVSTTPVYHTNHKNLKATPIMKRKTMIGTLAAAGCALLAATGIAQAQLGGADLGSTAPVPGVYDISQLLTTGDTIQLQDGALNDFYDNTSGGAGEDGSSFTTGANAGGYLMKSLALKFGGGGSVGYAGGSDTTLNPGWTITIFQLSGTGNTIATPIATNTVGTLSGTGNSGADWIQLTGFNLNLLPNTTYAWTILSPGYDDLAYATGTPYTGGAICRIPPNGGAVTYYPADHDSATFNVGLGINPSPLTATDLGTGFTPTPGANDIAQVQTSSGADGSGNNYYDNDSDTSSPGAAGSSFTTGGNAGGYIMNSLALKFDGSSAGGNDTAGSQSWRITIFQLSGAGNSVATPISTNTSIAHATSTAFAQDWINFSGFDLFLQPNTAYAYVITTSSSPGYTGYDDLGVAPGLPYAGRAICRIQRAGGTVTYYPADNNSASFDINVSLRGYPAAGIPAASQNPVYALSPITVTNTATGPGSLTYQWQTNSDLSGDLSGAWVNVGGATQLILPVVPANLNPGGGDYTLDYQLVVANSAGSVTSAPLALLVHAASAPVLVNDTTPSAFTTYAGGTATFTASFAGTTPLTNDWQGNTTGSFLDLAGQTNATLTLTNLQLSQSGSYQLLEKNSQGQTASDPAVLTVLPGLPPPTAAQAEDYQIYTNGPFAYWRLNETNNPGTATVPVLAYDYSGHGFFPTYGVDATTGNAGPQPPAFPGFTTNELAAGISFGNDDGFLTVPPLNLNTNTVTFVAWINPNGPVSSSVGLLFNRNNGDAAGFGFNGTQDNTGMANLGYTWNDNASGTWGWNSLLFPLANQWNFVAYVLTPTNMTAYLGYVNSSANTTNFSSAVNVLAHQSESFSGGQILLGADPQQSSQRTFNGLMDEVALYNKALSKDAVQSLFLTGVGSKILGVSLPPLASRSVFSGSRVQLNASASGSAPITYQWQASGTGLGIFTNLPNSGNYSGVTSGTLTINNVNAANALDYQVIAANVAGSVTSSISTLSVSVIPPGGLWTVDFQLTNDTINFATSPNSGGGQYTGLGILGAGNWWNPFVNNAGAFGYGTFTTASDYRDDGVTPSGIYASVTGSDDSTLSAPAPSSSIFTLLDQYVFDVSTLTFSGVPDGTYNLVIYGTDGGFSHGGANLTVNAANGVQNVSTVNDQDGYFSANGNTALFTNVQTSGGTLTVGFTDNVNESSFNGAQLQLVSYSPTINTIPLTSSFTNNTLTLSWPEGLLETSTNLSGPWNIVDEAPPITVNTTNAVQFYRLQLE